VSPGRRPARRAAPATRPIVSPASGEVIGEVRVASPVEIADRLASLPAGAAEIDRSEALAFLDRLRDASLERRDELIETTVLETGFTEADCREMLDGTIEFLRDFAIHAREQDGPPRIVPHSYGGASTRQMQIMKRPYRCVGGIVPQNASFVLAITMIASALYAGARIVLRPSLQCGLTGAWLEELVAMSRPPDRSVHVLNCLANDFIEACQQSDAIDLIHYIGSNDYALDVLTGSFRARKSCLLDGQGNGLLYVDRGFPVHEAAELVAGAATRFNGETCTSVNGVLAHESLYPELRDALVAAVKQLKVGHPLDPGTRIGPLFSTRQAAVLDERLRMKPHRMVCGGQLHEAYFAPAIVENVSIDEALAREGCFGPAFWIQPVSEDTALDWIRANVFPLSDTILSTREDQVRRFAASSRAARVCVNADPSLESAFEPWGGYPPSGMNPVSVWIEKYRQSYQMDGEPRHLKLAGA
jgi:acyl-CoA reductase-like NAD-dependent aldehyde dehydrogenase